MKDPSVKEQDFEKQTDEPSQEKLAETMAFCIGNFCPISSTLNATLKSSPRHSSIADCRWI